MTDRTGAQAGGLWRWSVFAAVIAAAGLPIYIHAPQHYVQAHGLSLAAMGAVLAGLRVLDVVQDPALGWLSDRLHGHRRLAVAAALGLLVLGMVMLFALPPVGPVLLWFALSLAILFTAFSFLTITFYAEGLTMADRLGTGGHVRLAAWRESGALVGISLAAMAPTLLAATALPPMAAFALGFAALAAAAGWAMRHRWTGTAAAPQGTAMGLRALLRDAPLRWLLLLALVNATPVAITSTLFLFYVGSALQAPGWEGPLLILFFLSAAGAAPLWAALARRHGVRPVLAGAMALSLASFAWVLMLGAGDLAAFAAICVLTGAATGADLTLLPALFARRLADLRADGAEAAAFGLWSFLSKASLALAAGGLLPWLQLQGYQPGAANDAAALRALVLAYAGLPAALKLGALALLLAAPLPDDTKESGT